jgi:hypothetical protein
MNYSDYVNLGSLLQELQQSARYDRSSYSFANKLEDYSDIITSSYTHWSPPIVDSRKDEIEIIAPSLMRIFERNYDVEYAIDSWKREILHLCLFVDKVWLPDPSELIVNILGRPDMETPMKAGHASWIANINGLDSYLGLSFSANLLKTVEELYPLVDAGIVAFYPPIEVYKSEVAFPLFGENRYFTDEELVSAWPDLFVSEGLLFADALNASYAALDFEEFNAISRSINSSGMSSTNLGLTDSSLIAALPQLKLPFFSKLDARLLVNVRQDEQAFDDFRAVLRKFSRELIQGLEDPRFSKTVAELEKEELEPKFKELADSINTTKVLRESLSDEGIAFAAGAIGWLVAGDPLISLAGIAGGSALLAVRKILQNKHKAAEKFRPAARVVYSFHSGRLKLPRKMLSSYKRRDRYDRDGYDF